MPHPTDAHDDAPMFAADAFRLSDAQADLIDKARGFGKRVLAPRAAQHDRDATFPIENFRDMRGEGLLSIGSISFPQREHVGVMEVDPRVPALGLRAKFDRQRGVPHFSGNTIE